MINEEEMLEARQRSREWNEAVEEYCPQGGALLGDESGVNTTASEPIASACPDHLSERARAEWNRISVEQKETLTPADAPALAAYCAAYARWVEAEENINKVGPVVLNKLKNPVQNPYLPVAQQSLETMHKFLTLLQKRTSAVF